jgi:hypothetical protein
MLIEEKLNESLENELRSLRWLTEEVMLELLEEKLREILTEPSNVLNELFDGHGFQITDRP